MRTLRETYIDLIFMGSRKRVNWEHGDLERGLKGRAEAGRGKQRKM